MIQWILIVSTSGAIYFMSVITPFRMPTIALAPSMDTALHFNFLAPCSEKLMANFVKILAAVVAVPVGR